MLDHVFYFCCSVRHKIMKHSAKCILFLMGRWKWYYEKVTLFGRHSRLLWSVRYKCKINEYRLFPEGIPLSCTDWECGMEEHPSIQTGSSIKVSVLNLLLEISKFIYICFCCGFALQVFHREMLNKIGIG